MKREKKYLTLSCSRYTTLNGTQVLVDLFFLGVVLVIATERCIVGLTGTGCVNTRVNNLQSPTKRFFHGSFANLNARYQNSFHK